MSSRLGRGDRASAGSAAQGSTPLADEEPITAIPPPPAADPLKVALGEQLFGDRRLSHDGNLACLSCHDTRTNGTRSAKPSPNHLRTLSVFDAALNFRFNWEGNFRNLEAQIESSLENPVNLATSASEVVEKLKADPEMTRRFSEAYGRPPDRASLLDAIATYVRSLRTPGSRFDLWLGGDASALSPEELEGYRLFKSLRMRLLPPGRQRRRQSLRAPRRFSSAWFRET